VGIARSTAKLFLSEFSASVIGFLAVIYFARELSSTQLGVFFLFQAIIGITTIFVDLGVNGAVEKRLSENQQNESILTTGLVIKSILLVITIAVFIIIDGKINQYVSYPITGYLVVALVFRELAEFSKRVLIGEHRVDETASLNLARQILWAIIGITLLQIGYGVKSLLVAFILSHLIQILWGVVKISTPLTLPSRDDVPSIVQYSKYFFISQAGGRIYSWIDVAILGLFVVNSSVSAYELAWRVTLLTLLFSQSLANVIFPEVSESSVSGGVESVEQMIPKALSATFFISIPSFFGILVVGRNILTTVFGSEYAFAWAVLIILMAEKLFQCPHRILARVSEGIDRPEFGAYATITSLVINIILNFALIPRFGIAGGAFATLLSFGANTGLHARYLSRHVEIVLPYNDIGWYVLSSLVMLGLLFIAQSYVNIQTPIQLLLFIGLGIVVYVLTVLSNTRIQNDIQRVFRAVIGTKQTKD
jgi:O-antigen/teichoic acid export membrane protein